MLDVSDIHLALDELDDTDGSEEAALRRAVLRRLHLTSDDLRSIELRKRSIDARKRGDVRFGYTVRIALRGGANAEGELLRRLARRHHGGQVRVVEAERFSLPKALGGRRAQRPLVVGAGCAGLFCALALAQAGLEPLLVERGRDAARRTADVERFIRTGTLELESNIQFGLGGAGSFSDGKLDTGTKSAAHRFILQTLVDAGAPRRILWDARPHVGSDLLPTVVTRVCERIEAAGGELRLGTKLTRLDITRGRVTAAVLERRETGGILVEERRPVRDVVLACGHSARDVFELLCDAGVTLERKAFAMGVRIEHLQANIDRAQYGQLANHPMLGAAPYKLVAHPSSGRPAFTFCMCPGGYVVAAASERGGVVTNGMSRSDRAGTNANSGLLANVLPEDLEGEGVLAGVTLQRHCERAAFASGGGSYAAPAQLVADFLQGVPSTAQGGVSPTYPRGVSWKDVGACLPPYVTEALRRAIPAMDRRLHGFAAPDAVLTGVETRSSSPVRVVRGKNLQSVSTAGLWPCGEGAGYAGGIMSAATDGLRVAQALADSLTAAD